MEVFHGRIKNLFDRRTQAMDFVDKQHVVRLEIGEECRQIT